MSSGFLDLAYLIEISIVFNLAYREVKPLFDKQKIQEIHKITNRKEVKNTIAYCQNNSDKLAEEAVINSYKKFIFSEKSLSKEIDGLYWIKWINFNISIVLCILLFATMYQHFPIITLITDNFEMVWWTLFFLLFISIITPISSTYSSNRKIKSIYKTLESDSKKFLDTHSKYLTEKAEKQPWS